MYLRAFLFGLMTVCILVSFQDCAPFRTNSLASKIAENADPVSPANSSFKIGTLGDSLSLGYNISAPYQADIKSNWSSGADLEMSHLNQLRRSFASSGRNVSTQAINLAVAGQTVLSDGSTFLANAEQMKYHEPDYVTVEIGVNDLCAGNLATPQGLAAFQSKVQQALTNLKSSARPPKAIVLTSIPNVLQLTQIQELMTATIHYGQYTLTCPMVWAQLCPAAVTGGVQGAQAFAATWTAANAALASAAQNVGNPVVFDQGALATGTFNNADISRVDCYHPNLSGQSKMAASTWQAVKGPVLYLLGMSGFAQN